MSARVRQRGGAVVLALATLFSAGCASNAVDVKPVPASPSDFASWSCDRMNDELDRVQRRATELAYSVDERFGNNIIALGVGLMVFWPALLAMRPDGIEASDLAQLKGRDEALRIALRNKSCPPADPMMSPARAEALPVALGERLVYEERVSPRLPGQEITLRVSGLRRDGVDFMIERDAKSIALQQDLAGNAQNAAPFGLVHWRRLLKTDLELGQVLVGEIFAADEERARGRVRGQVVAVGPQTIVGRRFDVAVIELFGDVARNDAATRLDGVLAIDRSSGIVVRLELDSGEPAFALRRVLVRVEPAN